MVVEVYPKDDEYVTDISNTELRRLLGPTKEAYLVRKQTYRDRCDVTCSTRLLPCATMFIRGPATLPATPADRERVLSKPFKAPSAVQITAPRAQPTRKRKRVSYKGAQADESDSDDDARGKKRKKKDDAYRQPLADADAEININKRYPVFTVKPKEEVFAKKFAVPTITNAAGELVPVVLTGVSLGIRPQAKLIPRPLHDPMADHAIVLYDPTIDARETDEERKERLKEEEKEKAAKEAQAKTAGMYNPHKSLRQLLGEGSGKKKESLKVPVVIDPLLSKVLRPHQVEGVKVGFWIFSLYTVSHRNPVSLSLHKWYGG